MDRWLDQLNNSAKIMIDPRKNEVLPNFNTFSYEYWNQAFTPGTIEYISRNYLGTNAYYPSINYGPKVETEESMNIFEDSNLWKLLWKFTVCAASCVYVGLQKCTTKEVLVMMVLTVANGEGRYSVAGHACKLWAHKTTVTVGQPQLASYSS